MRHGGVDESDESDESNYMSVLRYEVEFFSAFCLKMSYESGFFKAFGPCVLCKMSVLCLSCQSCIDRTLGNMMSIRLPR